MPDDIDKITSAKTDKEKYIALSTAIRLKMKKKIGLPELFMIALLVKNKFNEEKLPLLLEELSLSSYCRGIKRLRELGILKVKGDNFEQENP